MMKKTEVDIPTSSLDKGQKALVPSEYLYGIKRPSEFSPKRTKSIRNAIAEHGSGFLESHPITLAFLPDDACGVLAIFNGHHRAREAGNHNIFVLPAIIYSHALLSTLAAEDNSSLGDPDAFKNTLLGWTDQVVRSFSRKYRPDKHYSIPKALQGVTSYEQFVSEIQLPTNQFGIVAVACFGLQEEMKIPS